MVWPCVSSMDRTVRLRPVLPDACPVAASGADPENPVPERICCPILPGRPPSLLLPPGRSTAHGSKVRTRTREETAPAPRSAGREPGPETRYPRGTAPPVVPRTAAPAAPSPVPGYGLIPAPSPYTPRRAGTQYRSRHPRRSPPPREDSKEEQAALGFLCRAALRQPGDRPPGLRERFFQPR